jgi:hypothetical protein
MRKNKCGLDIIVDAMMKILDITTVEKEEIRAILISSELEYSVATLGKFAGILARGITEKQALLRIIILLSKEIADLKMEE